MSQIASIPEIEEATYWSWPGIVRREHAGWRLRAAEGVTGRANSVWAMRFDGSSSLDDAIAEAERFYTEQGLPARFQINGGVQPPALDGILEQRGYTAYSRTQVQTAPLSELLQRTPGLARRPDLTAEVAEEYDDEWFALYRRAAHMDDKVARMRTAILREIRLPSAYATVRLDGGSAGMGLGVVHGNLLGVYCVETLPHLRRRGVATAVMRTLGVWAHMHGASGVYLQVVEENHVAQTLYAGLGFNLAYRYHYRILPPPQSPVEAPGVAEPHTQIASSQNGGGETRTG